MTKNPKPTKRRAPGGGRKPLHAGQVKKSLTVTLTPTAIGWLALQVERKAAVSMSEAVETLVRKELR